MNLNRMNRTRFNEPKSTDLTPREMELTRLRAEGGTIKEIALALNISQETVKRHISNIFDKKGFDNSLDLALWYINEIEPKNHVETIALLKDELEATKADRDRWKAACSMGDAFIVSTRG
jgi:DNA-binding CsgD family transcriptional regulator